jgi:thiamine-phosphate pyrophosphorylase
MKSKKKLLGESSLYAVIDKKICGNRSPLEIAALIGRCGARIWQLRDKASCRRRLLKEALQLAKLAAANNCLFIVNDHLDIAKLSDSDGLHLGQEDISLRTAREILGKNKIIGVSCHSLKQALLAQKQGADYIGFGPIFKTATKPLCRPIGLKSIKLLKRKIRIPIFTIGGIKARNLSRVKSAGARRVVVSSAICQSSDPAGAARELSAQLN